MDKVFEKKHHRLEVFHWWTVSRRAMIMKLIKAIGIGKDVPILEIGCSVGLLLGELEKAGFSNVRGVDISADAIDKAREAGYSRVEVGDAAGLAYDQEFDLIVASDVLEHIKEESSALAAWQKALRPGGRLVIFLPAHKFFWSQHDEINQHYRRYDRAHLVKVLRAAGFDIERVSYWNMFLFFAKLFMVILDKIFVRVSGKKQDQFIEINPIVNRALIALLALENAYTAKYFLPFGVSVFAVAKKR